MADILHTTCSNGIYDCDYSDAKGDVCAPYDGRYVDLEGRVWTVVVGAAVMCIMAFGVGANDAANAWGTSVGSGAVPLKVALITAGIFEMLGAVTLGYGVSSKLQEGVSSIEDENCWACGYCNSRISIYDMGMFASLVSSALFLLLATCFKVPVSTTHAVVGAIMGMTLLEVGDDCVDWSFGGVGGIFASWVLSPLLAGLIAIALYAASQYFVFRAKDPAGRIIFILPGIFTLVSLCMLLLIFHKSAVAKNLPESVVYGVSFAGSALVYICVYIFAVPKIVENLPSITDKPTIVKLDADDMTLHKDSSSKIELKLTRVPSLNSLQDSEASTEYHCSKDDIKLVGENSDPTVFLHCGGDIEDNTTKAKSSANNGSVEDDVTPSHRSKSFHRSVSRDSEDVDIIYTQRSNSFHRSLSRDSSFKSLRDVDGDHEFETKVDVLNPNELKQQVVVVADKEDTSLIWDIADAQYCYRYLLVFNAALLSYAHGANDTANSTAPFSAVYSVYRAGLDSCDDIGSQEVWVLVLAGGFVAVGVYALGENVIQTVGRDLAEIDFVKGFSIQFATCISVLIASYAGFPVSSTHCQVGAIIFLGWYSEGSKSVAWNMVGPIIGAWVLTVPLAGIVSACLLLLFKLGLE